MSNGYPPSASPLGGSPSPGPSPALGVGGGSANKGSNPSRHSPQPPPPPPPPHPHRANLRVVIPTPLAQPLSEDTNYDVIVSSLLILNGCYKQARLYLPSSPFHNDSSEILM